MSWLPPEVAPAAVAGLLGASFATSFLTAAFGIGGGIALLAVLATLLPPAALIPVHGVIQLGSNAGRALLMRAAVRADVVPPFVIGAALGAVLGGRLAVALPPAAVEVGVGLFVVWSVLFRPPAAMRRAAWLAGAISSFLTMFFGATGPFVVAYLRTLDLERQRLVATHAVLMTLQHTLKTAVFAVLGFAFAPWLAFVAAMIAAGFLGTVVGRAVLVRMAEGAFRRVLDVLLVLLALRLIWSGLSG